MELFEKLIKSIGNVKKKLLGPKEQITIYVYNPREHSRADKIKHQEYSKSIVNGALPNVHVSDKKS
ncbi:MAG: hypothetical protein PHD15_04930 [Clostridia bacterium]|nr:hypothetical protein [Clostridia bacterium]MDD4387084.1 hypothetical protein [Clostridia bacterium]